MNGVEAECETMATDNQVDAGAGIEEDTPSISDELTSDNPTLAAAGQVISQSQIGPHTESARHTSATQANVLPHSELACRNSTAQANAFLVFSTIVISVIWATLQNYSNIFPTDRRVVRMTNLFDMQQLPPGFYLLMFANCGFSVSMIMTVFVVWSQLDRDRNAFYLRTGVLFVVATVFISYALLLQALINLRVRVEGDYISGFGLLWLYSICILIICGIPVLVVRRNIPRYSGI